MKWERRRRDANGSVAAAVVECAGAGRFATRRALAVWLCGSPVALCSRLVGAQAPAAAAALPRSARPACTPRLLCSGAGGGEARAGAWAALLRPAWPPLRPAWLCAGTARQWLAAISL